MFSVMHNKTVHLVCSNVLSAQKVYNFHRHYEILNKDKFDVLEGKLLEDKENEKWLAAAE